MIFPVCGFPRKLGVLHVQLVGNHATEQNLLFPPKKTGLSSVKQRDVLFFRFFFQK